MASDGLWLQREKMNQPSGMPFEMMDFGFKRRGGAAGMSDRVSGICEFSVTRTCFWVLVYMLVHLIDSVKLSLGPIISPLSRFDCVG